MLKRIGLMAAVCLLLPLCARAWSPETVWGEREELPAQVRALLPEDAALAYAYPVGDMIYAWTKDEGGTGAAYVFSGADGAYTLLSRSAPIGLWNGLSPSLGYCGKAFYTIAFSESFSFTFHPWDDGRWALGGAYFYGEPDIFLSFYPHAVVEYRYDRDGLRRVYGTWTQDLYADALDVAVLPQSFDDALSLLDTRGWAVIRAAETGGLTPLRAGPLDTADALSYYYTGAPVQVLESRGAWCYVNVAGAEGWVSADALVLGEEMREVAAEFPPLVFTQDAYAQENILYARPYSTSAALGAADAGGGRLSTEAGGLLIIGVTDGAWYHVMNLWGDCGYIEIQWFYEGNG